jgi:hypothetical protein
MSTKKGFSLAGLINKVVSRFRTSGTKSEPKFEISADCKNPWAYNLERLSRHKFPAVQETAEVVKQDELSTFVTELAQKTVEHETKKADARKTEPKFTSEGTKRPGDKTINDMASWWQQAVVTGDEDQKIASELPGKPRLLKRWFE